jgi:hypothetical protein
MDFGQACGSASGSWGFGEQRQALLVALQHAVEQ